MLTVTNAHPAEESGESVGIEDIADHAVGFTLVEATLGATGDDAAGILAAVLEEREAFADLLRDLDRRIMGEQA